MRSLLFNLFFYGFTLVMALVCYIAARTSTRERLRQEIGSWGRTMAGAVLTAAEDRHARCGQRGLGRFPGDGISRGVGAHACTHT